MAFSSKWLEEPPEIPNNGEKAPNQMAQLASHFRKLVSAGSASQAQIDWLYDFEKIHTPAKMRTAPPPVAPPKADKHADAAAVAEQEGKRLDRILDSLADGIRELRTGFTTVIGELRNGITSLNAGYEEIRLGNQQLQADQRSFLGILFPQTEALLKNSNESMEAYRKAVLREAEAATAVASAQNGGEMGAAEKVLSELFTEAAKQKLGLGPKPAEKSPEKPAQGSAK